jgi:hypothetical protein
MGGNFDDLRVAILGPLGTYTHEACSIHPLTFLGYSTKCYILTQAAHKVFGSNAVYEEQSSISGYQSSILIMVH